jgi:hypothetical protein
MNNAADLRAPGARARGDGMLASARERLGDVRERGVALAERKADSLASGLGWFSVGLGLAQVLMPDRVAEVAGIDPTPENVRLMRSFGLRELTSGVGILTQPTPDKWMWSRVVGDVLDLAMLGVALGNDKNHRGRTVGATLAVLGVTGLDLLAAKELSKRREMAAIDDETVGERTVFRIITVKTHPANAEKDWNDFVANQGSDETRSAVVTFAQAPGAQGTEIRAELSYTPRAGKIGETVQKMRHKSPGQKLGMDLKHFKMLCETGEITNSDASIHKHMHPAQPDESLGNANLIQEGAR